MATEFTEAPKPDTGADPDKADHGRRDVQKSGRSSHPDSLRVDFHDPARTPGFNSHRENRPTETRTNPKGEVVTLENKSEISQELRDRLTVSLENDMKQLIGLREDYNQANTDNDADFKKMLADSGHKYYIELFDQLVEEQPGTTDRSFAVNKEALKAFMAKDKGVVTAYRIKMKKTQEQALAAAMVMSVGPDEPENDIPGRESGRADLLPISKAGILRRAGRRVDYWSREKRTTEGRPKLFLDSKGKLTLALTGANVAGAAIGGIALGVPGALIGAGAVDAMAALVKLSSKGVTERIEISADALRTLQGDPSSPTPEKRVPDRAKIKWMKDFYKIDPNDFTALPDGQIIRKNNVAETRKDLQKDLIDDLRGDAKLIEDFQKDDGIRPELRRPGAISWIFEESRDPLRHNTEDEDDVMKAFNANFGGIKDKDGNNIMRMDIVRDARIRVPQETVTPSRNANYDVDALFHFNASIPLPAGTEIPWYTDPTTGRPVAAHRARAGEILPVPIDIPRRSFSSGDSLPMGTIIPAHRDASNRYVPEERVTTTTRTADHQFKTPGRRIEDGEAIPAGTVLAAHDAPLFDPAGKQVKEPVENIPPFQWENLDVTGNADRWMAAEEQVIDQYVNEVFQNLVDGKTDHRNIVRERLRKAREGHSSGKMPDAERKKLTREQEGLKKDRETLTAENTSLDTYQTKVAEKRKELARLKREADAVVRGISINGKQSTDLDAIQKALQDALGEKAKRNKETVTIGGQTINSIEGEYTQLDEEIGGKVESYMSSHVEPAVSAVSTAETSLADSKTNQEYTIRSRNLEAAQRKEQNAREAAQKYEQSLRESDRYKKKAERIEARRLLIQGAIDKLSESNDALGDSRAELTSNETEGRENSTIALSGMEAARERIAATWRVPGADTDRDLATKSYDELVRLINEANENDPTKTIGWPESGNMAADNRLMLIHAMAEARARLTETQLRRPNPDLGPMTKPPSSLSELDLYALTAEEIYDSVPVSLHTANKTNDLSRISAVKDAVDKRLAARQAGLDKVMLTVDDRTAETAEKLEKVIEKGISVPQADAIERTMDRYPEINEQVMQHMPQQADRDKLFAYERNPSTGVTEVNEEKAYENIMNLLFNHKEDYNVTFEDFKAGPEAAHARNQTVLNKQELSDMLFRHFRLARRPGMAGASPQQVFEAVRSEPRAKLANFFANTLVLEHLVNKIP